MTGDEMSADVVARVCFNVGERLQSMARDLYVRGTILGVEPEDRGRIIECIHYLQQLVVGTAKTGP